MTQEDIIMSEWYTANNGVYFSHSPDDGWHGGSLGVLPRNNMVELRLENFTGTGQDLDPLSTSSRTRLRLSSYECIVLIELLQRVCNFEGA